MRASLRRQRGVTLIELVVATLVSAIVIAGALALLSSQQRAYQDTASDRGLQDAARLALGAITDNLRHAGMGVDAGLAFDFGDAANLRMDRGPTGLTFSSASLACGAPVSCRDRIDGPDELAFLARDPAFGKPLRAAATAASGALTLQGPLNSPLRKGQILQVMCYSGNMTWAYLQVSTDVAVTAAATFSVPIESSGNANFPRQNAVLADTCFQTVASSDPGTLFSAAKVFKVDRYRYFIASYDGRPYLMLDQGLSSGDGPIYDVVAPDVEDLQVAYIYSTAAANQLVGATPGAAVAADPTGVDLAPADGCPVYSDDIASPMRLNHHPGNIRAVRVSLVIRTATADPTVTIATVPAALNRPDVAGTAGHRRLRVETTAPTRNMDSRAPYFPTFKAAAGGDQLNVGGG
jgi:type IV pilus assembly protein PilW